MARSLPSIDELVASGRLVAQAPDPVALRAMLAAGYRIDAGKGAHAITIDAADVLTGGQSHAIFTRLQRMRRRRNDFMYETVPDPSETDLRQAQRDVTIAIALADRALEALA